MLAAGAFRWHWLSKVGEELADLWVLKFEHLYICRQEGLNKIILKVIDVLLESRVCIVKTISPSKQNINNDLGINFLLTTIYFLMGNTL